VTLPCHYHPTNAPVTMHESTQIFTELTLNSHPHGGSTPNTLSVAIQSWKPPNHNEMDILITV
jgi:hypothetical protein